MVSLLVQLQTLGRGRGVPQVCKVPVPITHVQVLTSWGWRVAPCPRGAFLRSPWCRDVRPAVLLDEYTRTPPLPSSRDALTAAPSFDGAGLHGAIVSTWPWAAECAVPGPAEPAALPLCHLGNHCSVLLLEC